MANFQMKNLLLVFLLFCLAGNVYASAPPRDKTAKRIKKQNKKKKKKGDTTCPRIDCWISCQPDRG
jgi:hypothetical protein